MTASSSPAARPESADSCPSGHSPLLLLIGASLFWLVAGGVLALIASIQLHTPGFLSDCPFLTYGRVQAAQETALLYGWAVNSGLAVALWVLGRLGGAPLRTPLLAAIGAVFWNLALAAGLAGILTGSMTGYAGLQLPANVLPVMLAAYAAVATAGVLAWTGRRSGFVFIAQYYGVAALFVFPWIFSVAQVMLLFAPVHGTLQAVVAAWFLQNFTALVLAPFALAGVYYLVPKLSGRTLSHYDFAPHGFWVLLFLGGWAGGRHLVGGPVPAWVVTVGIVATFLLLFHFVVVAINLDGVFRSCGGRALRFAAVGLGCYLVGGALDALTAVRDTARFTQFTHITAAQGGLLLGGAFTFLIFAAVYHLVPQLTGKAWPSPILVRVHFAALLPGLLLNLIGLLGAGWLQGHDLNRAGVDFTAIALYTRPWLYAATAGQALMLLGNLAVALNFAWLLLACAVSCCSACCRPSVPVEAAAS